MNQEATISRSNHGINSDIDSQSGDDTSDRQNLNKSRPSCDDGYDDNIDVITNIPNRHNYSGNSNNYSNDNDNNNVIISNCDRPCKPIGISFFGAFVKFNSISAKRTFHKTLVLCMTFIAYTCFHMGRRPLSIVKNVLNRNCSDIHHITLFDQEEDITYLEYEPTIPNPITSPDNDPNWCDWAPFNDDATANQLLALLDSAFLFSYAFFMFFSGFLADRCNLRYFLSGGMVLSGFLLYAFGLSFYFNIHSMTYFVIIQLLSGAIQTTGWPSVVSCIGSWFDQSSRGAIFGLWNSNTNLGNILGATIAGYFVEKSWGLSFMVPGFIMSGCGILVFLFLVPKPDDVGLQPIKQSHTNQRINPEDYRERDIEGAIDTLAAGDQSPRSSNHRRKLARPGQNEFDSAVSETDDSLIYNNNRHSGNDGENSPLICSPYGSSASLADCNTGQRQQRAVSFWTCLAIPGVVEYSLCLGFAKLVSYTFLYWLPRYITQSTLNNSEQSAYLSVPFDIGGIFGAILAGYLSDKFKKSALTCTVMLILAIPAMVIYQKFASISNAYNICLQLMTGSLVNGPYALITTAVSTDLGSRIKDGKAMATVAAIIDGTGSIGAAIGPLVAGYISDLGWQAVFLMLMMSDLIAALCLIRVTLKEIGLR